MKQPAGNGLKASLTILILLAGLVSCRHQSAERSYHPESALSEAQVPSATERRIAMDLFNQASALHMQQRYEKAILKYLSALKYDPSAAIHHAIAQCYIKLDILDDAYDHIQKGLAHNADFLPLYEILGEYYLYSVQIDNAIETFQLLADKQPESLTTRLTLARIYELRDLDKAIAIYEDVLGERESDMEDDNYALMAKLAELYAETGEDDKQLAMLEAMYDAAPAAATLPYTLMKLFLDRKDFVRAEALLAKVSHTVAAEDVQYYFVQFAALVLEEIDSNAVMNDFARRYVARTDSFLTGYWLPQFYGVLLADKIDDREAVSRHIHNTLTHGDTLAEVPIRVSLFHFQRENFPAMIRLLERYEPRFDDNAEFPFYRGLAHFRQKEYRTAIEAMDQALQRDSSFVDAWAQLGIIHNELRNFPASDSAYEQALTLDPENPLINNNYAYSLSERGVDMRRAKIMTERALASDPENASYLDTMGWIYFQLGNYEKARTYIRQSLEQDDQSATVYEHLGDVYEKLGEHSRAAEAWEKALLLEPDRPSTRERLGRDKRAGD